MCRKLSIILLLCVAMLAPSIASAQELSIFAKQKVAIADIIDKNDRPLSDAIKTVVQNGIRDAFVNSNDYDVFCININEISGQLKAKGQPTDLSDICKEVGQRADFIVFTEILTSTSAFGVQNVEIIITSSLYRIATGSKILSDQVRTQPTEQSIRTGTAQLISKLFGVNMAGAESQKTPQAPTTTYNQQQPSHETANEIFKRGDALYKQKLYEEAIPLFRSAAEQNNSDAQHALGTCYRYGRGVSQDYYEAVKWYQKAAEQGHKSAQYSLGLCYRYGRGITQDSQEAAKWYRKAAEQGHPGAQCNLGHLYEKGDGVSLNYHEAVKWYRKAAEQGNNIAQCNLGLCYEYNRGVEQDYQEAVKWYRISAELGNKKAQYRLGRCYEKGYGVKTDIRKAKEWYRAAAEKGYEGAKKALDRIGGR